MEVRPGPYERKMSGHFSKHMRMVSWMCDIKLQDRAPSKGFRVKLALDDIISVLQNKL